MTSSNLITDIFDNGAETRLELDEERRLIAAAQLGDKSASETLILAYAPALRNAVSSCLRAFSHESQLVNVEDLRQQALLGLLEAIEVFDGEKYERLAALAPGYIKNAISTNAALSASFTVPERTLKRFFGILRAAEANIFEAAKIAPDYEMRAETFLAVLASVRNVDSYETILGSHSTDIDAAQGSREAQARPLWDGSEVDTDDEILVEAAFSAVNGLENDVLRLAYGFTDYDPVSDAEIGDRLLIGRNKAQRTRYAGLDKMRSALGVA